MNKINIITTKEGIKIDYIEKQEQGAVSTIYQFIGEEAELLKNLNAELTTEKFIDFFQKYHQAVINGEVTTE